MISHVFCRAVENGTNMLELDVRLTRDGQVVVHHDPDLKRLAGSALKLSELDYSQLPPLKSVVPIDTIPGRLLTFFKILKYLSGCDRVSLNMHFLKFVIQFL